MTAITTGTRVLVVPDPAAWLPRTPWAGKVIVDRGPALDVEVVDPLESGMEPGKVRKVPRERLSRQRR